VRVYPWGAFPITVPPQAIPIFINPNPGLLIVPFVLSNLPLLMI
jgi:hypothetical protein